MKQLNLPPFLEMVASAVRTYDDLCARFHESIWETTSTNHGLDIDAFTADVRTLDKDAFFAKYHGTKHWPVTYPDGTFEGYKRDLQHIAEAKEHIDSLVRGYERTVEALETIAGWKLPATGQTWENGEPMSYEAWHGTNGSRDFMRKIAKQALGEEVEWKPWEKEGKPV